MSEELFEQVHRRLLSENKQPNWNHQGENLLTGLLRCPECGGAMAASNTTNTLKDDTKKKIRYYSCATFRNKGASVCHANSIQAKVAEAFVADRLKEIIQVPEIVEQLVKELNKEKVCQVMPLEQELAVNQVEQSSLEEKLTRFRQVLDVTPEMVEDIQHEKFVTIQPFIDGNGRTARLLMNVALTGNGYPPIIVKADPSSRLRYNRTLEAAQVDRNLAPFIDFITELVSEKSEKMIAILKMGERLSEE